MSSNEKRETAVIKYFKKTPEKPYYREPTFSIGLMVFGVVAILIAFSIEGAQCVGIPALLFGMYTLYEGTTINTKNRTEYETQYKESEPKPSDEQVDKWHNDDLERIRKQSLSKLDLLPEQVIGDSNNPIMVVGPSEGAKLTVGKDNIVRFSKHDVVIVYLTDYHLAAYSCTVSMETGLETKEATQEYHYKDVVSVATQADNSRVFKVVHAGKDKPLADYQKFSLSVASGEKIEVVIAFPQLDDINNNAQLAPTGAENAVKTIRAMLREKKGGIQE